MVEVLDGDGHATLVHARGLALDIGMLGHVAMIDFVRVSGRVSGRGAVLAASA